MPRCFRLDLKAGPAPAKHTGEGEVDSGGFALQGTSRSPSSICDLSSCGSWVHMPPAEATLAITRSVAYVNHPPLPNDFSILRKFVV